MHDLMNDLATTVATEFFLRLDNENKENIQKDMLEKYRHMSFVREQYVAYKKFQTFERAKSLRTLLATSVGEETPGWYFYLSNKILSDLVPKLPLLRVLCLSGFQITEITRFHWLFETLEIAKLKDFKNLNEKISIEGLEKVQNAIHAHEANLSQKRLSELELVWNDEQYDSRNVILEKEVLNELRPHDEKLIQFEIRSYGGLEFPSWVGDPSFLNLKHVSISGCKRCTSLPPLAQLPSLKELYIKGLYGVEVVNFELFVTGRTFPSLEILSFSNMRGWKKWFGVVFPRLQRLEIEDCPNLVEAKLVAMPSLKVLEINDCPSLVQLSVEALTSLNVLVLDKCDSGVLRRLVEVASTVIKLEIRRISELNDVVWRGVIELLGAVEELRIEYCKEIRYMVKSDADAKRGGG
ncbi:putative leucine-rich repeat domain superfamily [Helianthus annuus]|uniref:Leucine-rich repeat domain superfamily n=1 Tax=Helianthus annuus TaxID=4232 RepID=A0A9K3EKN0_HELAN|nr:putative leucine-rich repeat domain superfamily [Helianthus annuus]KAJ0483311.1 putative leucine-rich repeat domain superfamily [Helianthus annuus]